MLFPKTSRGRTESNWSITDKGKEFDIVIPPGATAEIELPTGTITESGKPLAVGVSVLKSSGNRMKVASGRYRFLVVP